MSKTTEEQQEHLRAQVSLRQGEIVDLGDLTPASLREPAAPTLAIVASHDCDIAAAAAKDPFIEFFPLRRVKKVDKTKTHAKNARTLQSEAKAYNSGPSILFEIDAPSKFSIRKNELWSRRINCQYEIDRKRFEEFTDWLAARYRRAALPNKFEERYIKVRDDFWKLIRKSNATISAVLFLFDDGQERIEQADSEPYTLTIILVLRDEEAEMSFAQLGTEIEQLFEGCYGRDSTENAGIEIRKCIPISERVLTIDAYRRAIRHRIDWLSYETEPVAPIMNI